MICLITVNGILRGDEVKYSLKTQQRILEESSFRTVEELSDMYKIPISVINKWLVLNYDEEQLKTSVRQKLYNVIPLVEANIETIYSDYVICGISDKEWELCSRKISQIITDFAYKVYKTAIADSALLEYKKLKRK